LSNFGFSDTLGAQASLPAGVAREAAGRMPALPGCRTSKWFSGVLVQSHNPVEIVKGNGLRYRSIDRDGTGSYNQIRFLCDETALPIKETAYAASQEQGGHAGFLDYAGVAIDSLRANKLRSFLTLLGIMIGITSIISVISLIQGMDQYWKTKISNSARNTFVITAVPITTNLDKFFEMIRRNPDVHAERG